MSPRNARPQPQRSSPQEPQPRPADFINRELSWLDFNTRVLEEGLNPDNPLLERLNFLSIVSSNLDEFFMVRVGGLRQGASSAPDASGMGSRELLAEIARRTQSMIARQTRCLTGELLPQLAQREVSRIDPASLGGEEFAAAERFFREELFPALTPVAVESEGRFPMVPGLTLHLAFRLRKSEQSKDQLLALVPMPRGFHRLFQIPTPGGVRFVLVEDLVRFFAQSLFEGYAVLEAVSFRVTRNADQALDDEESDDLLEAMEEVLRARKLGDPVRLEVESRASPELLERLCQAFGIDAQEQLYKIDGPLDLRGLAPLASLELKSLRFPRFESQPVPAFEDASSPFEAIRAGDVLVHLPYESFNPTLELLRAAAEDPGVVAIKQTLYRTSPDSRVIAALERAALNGKQVTALVELKARFDEARNISWASRLAEAGAQVIYGVVGLKTHAKLLLIVRREADGIRRYLHLSTGNYNEVTARRYEDLQLFTCDGELGTDASNFFNAVTGYSEPRDWRRLMVAPTGLREQLGELIDREIARSTPEAPGRIILKMNSLADPDMVARLYRASQRGVKITLCVRGICCLRPGVRGLSQNIEVLSVVDRFLEHSRIYYFGNAGQEEVYLASADFMPRNLDRRLELAFPLRSEQHRARVVEMLRTLLADLRRAWRLKPDGSWERCAAKPGEPAPRAQATFMEQALNQAEESRVKRLSVFRPQGPGSAPGVNH